MFYREQNLSVLNFQWNVSRIKWWTKKKLVVSLQLFEIDLSGTAAADLICYQALIDRSKAARKEIRLRNMAKVYANALNDDSKINVLLNFIYL